MVTRKRSQHRYYSARPSTHMIPVASAPACTDDVDHAVTFVGKKQSKKKMSQSVKAKYLSPMRNTLNSSLELSLEKGGHGSISNISKHNDCSSKCCGVIGRSSPDSDIEGGRNKSYTYAINPESAKKDTHLRNPKSAGTIIISNGNDQRYSQTIYVWYKFLIYLFLKIT